MKNSSQFAILGIFTVVLLVTCSPLLTNTARGQTEDKFGCRVLVRPPDVYECTAGPYNTVQECVDNGCLQTGCVSYDQCRADNARAKEHVAEESNLPDFSSFVALLNSFLAFLNSYLVYLVKFSASLFDMAVSVAMAPLSNIKAVDLGWQLTRDLSNMFFIFMLLVIAIATILRLEKYGAKQLLAGLIVMAILVNFSLVIARTVVDASNLLGITFMRAVYPIDITIGRVLEINKLKSPGAGSPPAQANPTFQVASDVPSAVLKGNAAIFPPKQDPLQRALGKSANSLDQQVGEFFIQSIEFIFQLTAAYVFLALGILYIVRTVALILIFVLAPFGFVFFALPATRTYAQQWWTQLFNWSFFFPASAFLLYIAITWGFQMANFNIQGNQILNTALAFNYVATLVFLLASLLVARKMGIMGAETAIKFGSYLRKGTMGFVGRQSLRPVARGSEAFLNSRLGQTIAATPIVGQVMRAPALAVSTRVAQAKKEADRFKNLSPSVAVTMLRGAAPDVRAAAFDSANETKKRKMVQALRDSEGEAGVVSFGRKLKRFNLDDDVAAASGDLHTAMQILHDDTTDMPAPPATSDKNASIYQQRANDFLGKLNNDQIKNLNPNTIVNNDYFAEYHFNNAVNFNDVTNTREQIVAYSQMLKKKFGNSDPKTIADKISQDKTAGGYGNKRLAQQFETSIGINLVTDPNKTAIRSKRGQINIQGGGGAAPTP